MKPCCLARTLALHPHPRFSHRANVQKPTQWVCVPIDIGIVMISLRSRLTMANLFFCCHFIKSGYHLHFSNETIWLNCYLQRGSPKEIGWLSFKTYHRQGAVCSTWQRLSLHFLTATPPRASGGKEISQWLLSLMMSTNLQSMTLIGNQSRRKVNRQNEAGIAGIPLWFSL